MAQQARAGMPVKPDAAAVRAADWVHSWEGSKSLSAALRAAKEIGCEAAHVQAKDATAMQITRGYKPLVEAAQNALQILIACGRGEDLDEGWESVRDAKLQLKAALKGVTGE